MPSPGVSMYPFLTRVPTGPQSRGSSSVVEPVAAVSRRPVRRGPLSSDPADAETRRRRRPNVLARRHAAHAPTRLGPGRLGGGRQRRRRHRAMAADPLTEADQHISSLVRRRDLEPR
jgi:hypothetical protein